MNRSDLPRLTGDPDARSLRWGWALWIVGALALLPLAYFAGALPRLQFALLAAPLLLWLLWRGGRRLIGGLLDSALVDWQGGYYEYDGRQIRLLADAQGQLWIAAADVLDALDVTGSARDPRRLRLGAGRDGLRRAPGTRTLCFTERGLAAWLDGRSDPRVFAFRRWLDHQVLRPQQRRRVLAGLPASGSAAPDGDSD